VEKSLTYCVKAFDEIYSDSANRYRLCCHADVNKSISHMTTENTLPFDYFLSSQMEKIRDDMFEGKKIDGCEGCYKDEEINGHSHRTKFNEESNYNAADVTKVSTKLKNFGSRCNLGCYMCRPYDSSTRRQELKAAGLIDTWNDLGLDEFEREWVSNVSSKDVEKFNQNILDNIDRVRQIRIFGGEPVLLDRVWQFLDDIKSDDAKNIEIEMTTNLTHISYKNWSLKSIDKKFKNLKLGVSCDHFGKKLEFIRYPIDVQEFEKNLMIMKDHVLQIYCTVSILNAFDLKEIEEYYKDFRVWFEPVNSPASLSIKNLPNKDEIEYIPNELIKNELMKPKNNDEYKKGIAYIQALQNHRRGV
jgi:organic radical activating enzyme